MRGVIGVVWEGRRGGEMWEGEGRLDGIDEMRWSEPGGGNGEVAR